MPLQPIPGLPLNEVTFLTDSQKNKLSARGFKQIHSIYMDSLRELLGTGKTVYKSHLAILMNVLGIEYIRSNDDMLIVYKADINANIELINKKKTAAQKTKTIIQHHNEITKQTINDWIDKVEVDITYIHDLANYATDRHFDREENLHWMFDRLMQRNKIAIPENIRSEIRIIINRRCQDNWLYKIHTNDMIIFRRLD